MNKRWLNLAAVVLLGGGLLASPPSAIAQEKGATLFLSPDYLSATAGETFEVSVFLDTGGNTVNTLDAFIKFPSDKLQVVSPSIGKSIIGIWTSPPSFNNATGEVHFRGGIPSPGINTSNGLISTITFRAKSVGSASLSFGANSKVLLNDGYGTNILTNTQGGSYSLKLPQAEGPIVTSPTHPDQDRWYKNSTVALEWTSPFEVDGFSYVLSENPIDIPDDIAESAQESVSYKNLADGLYYFHIKAIRNNVWGGITRFAVKIDTSPPAQFQISILPKSRTIVRNPLIEFNTTDAVSGMNYYELKIVPKSLNLSSEEVITKGEEGFFIETPDRYVVEEELSMGDYDIIVRAFDNAGNFQEEVERMSIISPLVTVSASGIIILDKIVLPWGLLIFVGLLIILLLIYIVRMAIRLHRQEQLREMTEVLDDPLIKKKLERLHKLEEEHKKKKTQLKLTKRRIAVTIIFFSLIQLTGGVSAVMAQENAPLPPPIISTVAPSISNDELFYVVGVSDVADSEIIIYIQNLQDNQLTSTAVQADHRGDWFYDHQKPLPKGNYIVWTQMKVGNQLSPPSPQKEFTVSQTAFQIGNSRLSYETLYLLLAIAMFVASLILGGMTAYHFYHGRRRRRIISKEIREAETAIKEGFLALRQDIRSELAIMDKAKMSQRLSAEENRREKKLLNDLDRIETAIKREFADVKLEEKKA